MSATPTFSPFVTALTFGFSAVANLLASDISIAGSASYFTEQCKAPSSDAIKTTVSALLELAETDDCGKAAAVLKSRALFELQGKGISDTSVLAEFTSIELLDLQGNKVSDLSTIVKLPNLIHLRLGENGLTDASAS